MMNLSFDTECSCKKWLSILKQNQSVAQDFGEEQIDPLVYIIIL